MNIGKLKKLAKNKVEQDRDQEAYDQSGYKLNLFGESKVDARKRIDAERRDKLFFKDKKVSHVSESEKFKEDCNNISTQLDNIDTKSTDFDKDIKTVEEEWKQIKKYRKDKEMKIICGELNKDTGKDTRIDFDKIIDDKKNENKKFTITENANQLEKFKSQLDLFQEKINELNDKDLQIFPNNFLSYKEENKKFNENFNKLKSFSENKKIMDSIKVLKETNSEILNNKLEQFKKNIKQKSDRIEGLLKIKDLNTLKNNNPDINDFMSSLSFPLQLINKKNIEIKNLLSNLLNKIDSLNKHVYNLNYINDLKNKCDSCGNYTTSEEWTDNDCNQCFEEKNNFNYIESDYYKNKLTKTDGGKDLKQIRKKLNIGKLKKLAKNKVEQDRDQEAYDQSGYKLNLFGESKEDARKRLDAEKRGKLFFKDKKISHVSESKKFSEDCNNISTQLDNIDTKSPDFDKDIKTVEEEWKKIKKYRENKEMKVNCGELDKNTGKDTRIDFDEIIDKKKNENKKFNEIQKFQKKCNIISKKINDLDININDFEKQINSIKKDSKDLSKFRDNKNIDIECDNDIDKMVSDKEKMKLISKFNDEIAKIYEGKSDLEKKKNIIKKLSEKKIYKKIKLEKTEYQNYLDKLDTDIQNIKKDIILNCKNINAEIESLNTKKIEFENNSKKIKQEIIKINEESKKITSKKLNLQSQICNNLETKLNDKIKIFDSFIKSMKEKVDKCLKVKNREDWDLKCKSDFDELKKLNFPENLNTLSKKIKSLNDKIDDLIEYELDLDNKIEIEKQCKVAENLFNTEFDIPDLEGWTKGKNGNIPVKNMSLDEFNQCSYTDQFGNERKCPIPNDTTLGDCDNLNEMVKSEAKKVEQRNKTKKIKTKFKKNILNLKNLKNIENQIKEKEKKCKKSKNKKKCKEELKELVQFKNRVKKQKKLNVATTWDATTELGKEAEKNRIGYTRFTTVDKDVQRETELQNKSMKERIKESKEKFNKNLENEQQNQN